MIRILTLLVLFTAFSANSLCAGASAMVDRHIFTPDNIANTNEEVGPPAPLPVAALEKELSFTGILITPGGKQAIISEITKNESKKQKHLLKEGDQVRGMTIKEIGPNYVLLATKESNTRLNLYKGAKSRPSPVAEPVKADIPQQIAQQGKPKNEDNPGVPVSNPQQGSTKEKESTSPFGGGSKHDASVQKNPSTATNPFADLLNNQSLNSINRGNNPSQLPLNIPTGAGN